jgi:L-ribulokinase
MSQSGYVIGLDFGTDSVRAVLVNVANGNCVSSDVHYYPRWKEGKFCDPSQNQFRQHPSDHIEGIEKTIKAVVKDSDILPDLIKAICIDTTGSSPIAVDHNGTALCFNKGFEDNPNAMVILWKDHTAIKEAEEINHLARTWGGTDYTKFEGGIYSSEWFWAKILHVSRLDMEVRSAAYSWMEHCDYLTYLLVGSPPLASFKRSRCAAGHKAMWHASWGGLPSDEFLKNLDPAFPELKQNLFDVTYTSDQIAGHLSEEWSAKLGLSQDVVVSVGTFDAHAGAVGAEVKENTLVRVMGTSTCDIVVSSKPSIHTQTVKGICGQVDGSVIPGMIGLEAGQSAFGDLLAWFKDLLTWPLDQLAASESSISVKTIEEAKRNIIGGLTLQAEKIPISQSMPLALDWINGRRTPDANQALKTAIVNLSLGSQAPEIFKALVESICFGSKMIVDRFEEEGVIIDEVVGIGGVSKKSPFVMQTLADVLGRPIQIARSEQAPALGAAMYAATAAGFYNKVEDAIQAMGNGFEKTYQPNSEKHQAYLEHYETYKTLGKFVEENINN